MSSWFEDDESEPIVKAAPVAVESAVEGGITIDWRVDLDQRQPASVSGFSLPLVYKTTQGHKIVAGAQDKRVRIYSAGGSELNRVALAAASESGALQLAGGLVVIGDIEGGLYGIDIEKGEVSWKVELSSSFVGSPVAIDGDFIVQTDDNQVYRFSAAGEKLWSYSGSSGGLTMQLSPSPVVYKNRVYVAMNNGEIVALKADHGGFLWTRQLLLNNSASVLSELKVPVATPTVVPVEDSGRDEDTLLVPIFQGEMVFLSLLDGSTLNSRSISIKSPALLKNRRLYIADSAGAVSALDAASGETLWKQQVSSGELTGPVSWQGELWVANDQGKVYRLSEDGMIKGGLVLTGRIDRTPVITDNGVLVRNNLGTLYLLH
ncbi:outer membrane protein assembly factor BamB family protein [Mariprofundus micogutta]|nr:PQQ-binding-like beta-propeller repeat protein [Mariprofundus micogutta]